MLVKLFLCIIVTQEFAERSHVFGTWNQNIHVLGFYKFGFTCFPYDIFLFFPESFISYHVKAAVYCFGRDSITICNIQLI